MIVSKVEVQKNHKNYFNLYSLDDVYLFSVTEETLLHFNITKGKEFSDDELEEIQLYDSKMRCVYQAYRFLSRRPHLKTELKRKLINKKYTENTIEKALEHLENQNHIDDSSFIKTFIEDQMRLKKIGPLLIKKKLFEKGAVAVAVDQILNDLYSEELQQKNALLLFNQKIGTIEKADKIRMKEKLFRYLQQKGFSWPIIEKIFNQHLIIED